MCIRDRGNSARGKKGGRKKAKHNTRKTKIKAELQRQGFCSSHFHAPNCSHFFFFFGGGGGFHKQFKFVCGRRKYRNGLANIELQCEAMFRAVSTISFPSLFWRASLILAVVMIVSRLVRLCAWEAELDYCNDHLRFQRRTGNVYREFILFAASRCVFA